MKTITLGKLIALLQEQERKHGSDMRVAFITKYRDPDEGTVPISESFNRVEFRESNSKNAVYSCPHVLLISEEY